MIESASLGLSCASNRKQELVMAMTAVSAIGQRSPLSRSPRLAAPAGRRYKRGAFPLILVFKKAPMALERTFSILKPDVTRRNLTGAVNARIEAAGLRIVAQKRVRMTRAQAETFYGVHKERPFFGELVEMMTAAPVVVQVLEGDNAIQRYREVMGATNPEKADAGTIRKDFALSMGENSVHGSDAPETAAIEIAQFFAGNELVG
jgi:nucleoside-diphosphate kinase